MRSDRDYDSVIEVVLRNGRILRLSESAAPTLVAPLADALEGPLFGTLLAEMEAQAGQTEAGLATLDAHLVAVELSGQRWYEAEMHRERGDLLLRCHSSDATAAEVAYTRAIETARSQQTRSFELRAALSLAKLYQATGRGEAARELLAPAVAGFTEGPALPEVEQANRLLADLAKRADSTEATKVASQT